MSNIKRITIVLLMAMLVLVPVSQVKAAPIEGTGDVVSVTLITDPISFFTTVEVVLKDSAGIVQKVSLTLEDAITEGLVTTAFQDGTTPISYADPLIPGAFLNGVITSLAFDSETVPGSTSVIVTIYDGTSVPVLVTYDWATAESLGLVSSDSKVGLPVVLTAIPLTSIIYSHVVSHLGTFFGAAQGVTYDQLANLHDVDGYGYGVISQSLWMATTVADANYDTLLAILNAKISGDYSALGSEATSWGQYRKETLTSGKQNQGQVMSGKATPLPVPDTTTVTTTTKANNGNGNTIGNANSSSNGNDDPSTKTNNGKSGK